MPHKIQIREKTVTHNPIPYTTMIIFNINIYFYEVSPVVTFSIVFFFFPCCYLLFFLFIIVISKMWIKFFWVNESHYYILNNYEVGFPLGVRHGVLASVRGLGLGVIVQLLILSSMPHGNNLPLSNYSFILLEDFLGMNYPKWE